jgi:hypothetical protein
VEDTVLTKMMLSRELRRIKESGHADIESVLRSILFNSGTMIDWEFAQRELDRAFPET